MPTNLDAERRQLVRQSFDLFSHKRTRAPAHRCEQNDIRNQATSDVFHGPKRRSIKETNRLLDLTDKYPLGQPMLQRPWPA